MRCLDQLCSVTPDPKRCGHLRSGKIKEYLKFAQLVTFIAAELGESNSVKCSYDLFMGLEMGDAEDRYSAWVNRIKEKRLKIEFTDILRDGMWVPAVPIKG